MKKKSDSSQTPSATARHTVRRPQHNRETANDLVSRLGNRRAQAVIASGMGPIDVNRLGNRRASALAKARASTGKPTPKLQPSKKSRALAQVHYNRRLQRKASVPSRQDSSEREARAAGEAMANQTSVQAPARIRQHQPTPNFSVRDALGSGQPLSAPLQSFFSAFLGQDFSSVRIHTGDAADEAARNLNAEAFAIGPDIAFRRGRFAPETHTGKVLLGHELTHVAQGADGGEAESRIQRQESPHVEQEQVCWPEQNASFVEPVQESELSAEHQVTVEVAPPPALEGMEEGQSISLELTIPSGPGESWREDVYIVPTQYVFASESDARAPWCEGPAEAEEVGQGPEEPNLGPGSMGPNSSAPSYSDSPHTIFASGDIVYALDGPIEVLSASADYVVTTTYTKFAVGAGSTTLVRTEAGYILVDAGMHQRGGRINAQLADAIVQRLADAVGDEPIVEVVITHAHTDHTALLPRIYAQFEIGTLRINALQALLPANGGGTRLDTLVREMGNARMAFVESQVHQQLDSEGGFWDLAPAQYRSSLLNVAITTETARRLSAMHSTQIQLNIPTGGGVVAANLPFGEITIPTGIQPDSATITRPLHEANMVTILDPGAGAATEELLRTGNVRGGHETIDAQSSTYVLQFQSGARLLVLSDQRTDDIIRLREPLERALSDLGQPASLELFDMTHHLQRGWVAKTGIARAGQLAQVTQMLTDLAAQNPRAGRALVVSVHGDPSMPSESNFVDPSLRWFLESTGIHVVAATGGGSAVTSAQDVSVLQVALGDQRIEGIVGGSSMGLSPDEPLLQRAQLAQRALLKDLEQQQESLSAEGTQEDRQTAERAIAAVERQSAQLQSAIQSYILAVDAEIGRGPSSDRPAVAPPENGSPPAQVEAEVLRALLSDSPVIDSIDPRLPATVLVVLGREGMATLDADSRELLAARFQVNASAGMLRASSPLASRQEAVSALERYHRALTGARAEAAARVRPIFTTELQRVQHDLSTITGLSGTELTEIRDARIIAEQVARNHLSPLPVTSADQLLDTETRRNALANHDGLIALNGQLFRIGGTENSQQMSRLALRPVSVPRSISSSEQSPSQNRSGGLQLRSPRSQQRPSLFVPMAAPHPNVINVAGQTLVFQDGRVVSPSTPTAAAPGDYVIRGGQAVWSVHDSRTGRPLAGVFQGGEWWRVESNGRWTLEVSALGTVRRPGSAAIIGPVRGGPAEMYGSRHPGQVEARAGISGKLSAGGGAMALLLVANEILVPMARIVSQQRYNLQMARARLQFWILAGAAPTWEMRTGVHDELRPIDTEASTSIFGQPVYHAVTEIDLLSLRTHLAGTIHNYRDFIHWLDMGKQLGAIAVVPPMPREPSAEDRATPRGYFAIVAGSAGTRRGQRIDISDIIREQERRVLGDLDLEVRQRFDAAEEGTIYRLASGAQTPIYRRALGRPILSAAQLFGSDPWVRIIDRAEGGIGWVAGRRPWDDRVKVVPVNLDAERSAQVSAYMITDTIEDVMEEVEEGGREIVSRSPAEGRLESFVAGPMPDTSLFGQTRYYRHQQEPNTWTVAIGQLNEFWVDTDQLRPVEAPEIETYRNNSND